MSSHDAAEQVISMSLKGIETAAKISGEGAKNIAVYLYAVLNDQKKTKGKARLTSMLKSGKELKIFAVRKEDLATFVAQAKKYGVLYAALKDKNDIDGMCDIMVRAEDGAKISRIVERFKFTAVDMAHIKTQVITEDEPEKKQAAQKVKDSPSERSLTIRKTMDEPTSKPSVRKELNSIKNDQLQKTKTIKTKSKAR